MIIQDNSCRSALPSYSVSSGSLFLVCVCFQWDDILDSLESRLIHDCSTVSTVGTVSCTVVVYSTSSLTNACPAAQQFAHHLNSSSGCLCHGRFLETYFSKQLSLCVHGEASWEEWSKGNQPIKNVRDSRVSNSQRGSTLFRLPTVSKNRANTTQQSKSRVETMYFNIRWVRSVNEHASLAHVPVTSPVVTLTPKVCLDIHFHFLFLYVFRDLLLDQLPLSRTHHDRFGGLTVFSMKAGEFYWTWNKHTHVTNEM